jgi:purine-binding chemotaxis protein CheW
MAARSAVFGNWHAIIEEGLVAKMNPSNQLPSNQFVLFALDDKSFALELGTVHRVVRAVEVTPLPQSPVVILGVVNIQGDLFSVVNLRHRFRLPEREITPSDQFVLVTKSTSSRKLALVVDAVTGIIELDTAHIVDKEEIVPGLEYMQGVAKVGDDLILIHNLERCLSLQEENQLNEALAKMES